MHWALTPGTAVRIRNGPFIFLAVVAQMVQQWIANPPSRSKIWFRGSTPRHGVNIYNNIPNLPDNFRKAFSFILNISK